MKISYRRIRLSPANKQRLQVINDIIEVYQQQGYTLTLRQLYYQLVTKAIIPNIPREYSNLSKLLKEGRMAGIVDWEAIEDRLRQISKPASFSSPEEILHAAINQYELPRQGGQPIYVEVWVEKDALSGVLKRVTEKYHIPIMVNRGYSSISAMFDAYQRFKTAYEADQQIIILYLGDYDPSGIDMIRDIENRIAEFVMGDFEIEDLNHAVNYFGFNIFPIALTLPQIKQYNPPPNPVKHSDVRSQKFIARHGSSCWEVDALPPDVLNDVLEKSIQSNIDMVILNKILKREKKDKNKLKSLIQYL